MTTYITFRRKQDLESDSIEVIVNGISVRLFQYLSLLAFDRIAKFCELEYLDKVMFICPSHGRRILVYTYADGERQMERSYNVKSLFRDLVLACSDCDDVPYLLQIVCMHMTHAQLDYYGMRPIYPFGRIC